MPAHDGTPLTAISEWSKGHAQALSEKWITTAEQVVGIGSTADGVKSLAEQLGVTETEMRHLLRKAKEAIPPATQERLATRADTTQRGLGALPPASDPRTDRSGGKT